MKLKKKLNDSVENVNITGLLGCYASCFVFNPYIQKRKACALIPRMLYDVTGTKYTPQTHLPDYVRSRILELLTEIINRDNIDGSLAEVGVYKGHFSAQINSLLPERTLYLFDTFEGFTENDKMIDTSKNFISSRNDVDSAFKDTNIDLVLSKMTTPNKCIVKKGWFPKTTENLDDTCFALVSLDCDLYDPIYAGLEYFYPRLTKGGYMLLHDYNCLKFRGVKAAVTDYETNYGPLPKVPIPDHSGTLIITK